MEKDWYCGEVIPGRSAAQIVGETEHALALIAPRLVHPVHLIVVPKRHIRSLVDAGADDEQALAGTLSLVRTVAAGVEAEHGSCQVFTNLGGYQHDKHLHWHIVVYDREK